MKTLDDEIKELIESCKYYTGREESYFELDQGTVNKITSLCFTFERKRLREEVEKLPILTWDEIVYKGGEKEQRIHIDKLELLKILKD